MLKIIMIVLSILLIILPFGIPIWAFVQEDLHMKRWLKWQEELDEIFNDV